MLRSFEICRSIYLKRENERFTFMLQCCKNSYHVHNYKIFKKLEEFFRVCDSVFEFDILMYYVTISKDVMDNFLWKSS